MKVGVERGLGCYPDQLPEDERTQAVIPDQFRHEIATAYNLKGRGLVVLTSCSHRGVVNIVKQAQAACPGSTRCTPCSAASTSPRIQRTMSARSWPPEG